MTFADETSGRIMLADTMLGVFHDKNHEQQHQIHHPRVGLRTPLSFRARAPRRRSQLLLQVGV
jgi:hypothetical protein